MKKLTALLLLLALSGLSATALDRAHFDELNKKARELYQQKDWKGLREVFIELRRELPGLTPRFALRMASVEARLGHRAEALQWMQQYADMGLSYSVADDDDLKPLLAEEGFQKIAAQMKERTAKIARAEQVCVLSQLDAMPEDLTLEGPRGGLIVSSVQHHTLYRLILPQHGESACSMRELPLDEESKRWPVLAVSYDSRRKVIWATAAAMPGFTGFPKEDDGKTALLAIDPGSGKTLRRLVPETGGPAVLGDMSIGADGNVYVTDSIGGGVYRVHGNLRDAKLEKIAAGLFSPQTPVLARDGKRLLVADYSVGIAVINLAGQKPGQLEYLKTPDTIAAVGLDGLCLAGDSLIGVQNGTDPNRIIRFRLNQAQTAITSAEVIEQSNERIGAPTHAVQANGWFYAIANVGWDKVDDSGHLKAGAKFTAPVLLRFPVQSK
jgi:sugar lactone lactonase YvrE